MISLIGVTRKNNGFTLIEILLVITIVGIVLALAAGNFSKGYSRFQLNKTADDLLSTSRWAQAMAIAQERIYVLNFADDRRSYNLLRAKVPVPNEAAGNGQDDLEAVNGALGRMHTVPETVHLDVQEGRIEFYPDGTIDPAEIKLDTPQQKVDLSTSAMRGMMTRVDSE